MKVTVLGCGFSLGCPVLACNCKVCSSQDSYNKRKRCAILIENKDKTILIDFGPDIKSQLRDANVNHIDSIICTHAHSDHISGMDELRVYGYKTKKPINIYSDRSTLSSLKERGGYLFKLHEGFGPYLTAVSVKKYDKINLEGMEFQLFNQIHGINSSLGIRIGDFVYSNDVTEFPEKSEKYLHNIDTWLLDCIDLKRTHAHAGLEEVLYWNEVYKPKEIFLTNLSHNLDYHEFKKILPKNIYPAYDGLVIDVK